MRLKNHVANILLLLSLNLKLFNGVTSNLPLWTWECINEKCVPLKATPSSTLQSLNMCNIKCSAIIFWPQPTGKIAVSTTTIRPTSESFILKQVTAPSISVKEHTEGTFEIFKQNLYTMEKYIVNKQNEQMVTITIAINQKGQKDPRMLIDTDESYNLQVQSLNETALVHIFANSSCGARHALETLTQLIWFDQFEKSLLMLDSATISDAPRFRYRGIMLDTVSNYFHVKDIKRIIDAMAANKLNTFHWYITNNFFFPLHLDSVPFFAKYGTFGEGPFYMSDDVRIISKYAQQRGIRLILEVNVPTTRKIDDWEQELALDEPAKCIGNDISINECKLSNVKYLFQIYELLENMYKEIIQLTGVEDMFHLGNDICTNYLTKKHNSNDLSFHCLEIFRQVLLRLEKANNGTLPFIILWSSNTIEKIEVDLVKQVSNIAVQEYSVSWGQKHIKGIRTIVSHEHSWVFHNGHGTWFEETNGIPYNSWQQVYEHSPWTHETIGMEGGEGIVWSSTVSSGDLAAQVWPRGAALAERLWSDPADRATRFVQARLDVHRERLVTRGIRAAPLWSMWCTHNPQQCY